MKTVLRIYTPVKTDYKNIKWKENLSCSIVCIFFIILNIALGMYSEPIVELIQSGIAMFA